MWSTAHMNTFEMSWAQFKQLELNPCAFNYRGWTFNLYPTHRAVWQQITACIYYLIYFRRNFNLNFISSVSLGSGHCYINERSQKIGREKKEEEKRKEKKVQPVSWVPFLPSHFLCIWSVFVRRGRGGAKGGRPSGAD